LAARLLQIPLEDHIIVGDEKYFSFREVRRLWPEIERDATKLEKTIGRQFTRPTRRRPTRKSLGKMGGIILKSTGGKPLRKR